MTIDIERVILNHANVLPSQLRKLSDKSYFIDTTDPIKPISHDAFNISINFVQILVGSIAIVNYTGE